MHPFLDAFQAQTAAPGGGLGQLVPFIAIPIVFYFLLIRPQQKQRKQHESFLTGLKRGDEVVTQGGLIGEVVAVEDRVVTLNVGGGTKVRVLKAQILGQWKETAAAASAPEKK